MLEAFAMSDSHRCSYALKCLSASDRTSLLVRRMTWAMCLALLDNELDMGKCLATLLPSAGNVKGDEVTTLEISR